MKKALVCIFALVLFFAGCGKEEPGPVVQMGNPWKDYETLQAAQDVAGFTLPEEVDDFTAQSFRVMGGTLLEVTYEKDGIRVIVRKQSGEGEDLSGVYENFRQDNSFDYFDGTVTNKSRGDAHLMLIDRDGFSHSIYAPEGFAGSHDAFIDAIFEQSTA